MPSLPDPTRPLSEAETFDLFTHLLAGRLTDQQITDLLVSLAERGPSVDELVGAARAMRARLTPVETTLLSPIPPTRVDTCGTGGAPKTFNVSTAVALVLATVARTANPPHPDIQVAKHGNRSRTGRGSAEVLAALGVNIHNSPAAQARCLEEIGVCFSFAPDHHPAAKHAAAARTAIPGPTIFNLLGPVCNPAGAQRQLIGVYSPLYAVKLAHALARLNSPSQREGAGGWVDTRLHDPTCSIVVHSHDGLDELSTTAPNDLHTVRSGEVTTTTLDATTLGLPRAKLIDLQATSLAHAVELFQEVVSGVPGWAADLVLLNAGAALVVAGISATIAEGVKLARAVLVSGRVAQTLDALIRLSNQDPLPPSVDQLT